MDQIFCLKLPSLITSSSSPPLFFPLPPSFSLFMTLRQKDPHYVQQKHHVKTIFLSLEDLEPNDPFALDSL